MINYLNIETLIGVNYGENMINDDIKNAVDVVQRAQRNYDRTKSIPQKDLDTMIYAAEHSPSKQNETHYQLNVYTNDTIEKLYRTTKEFTVWSPEDLKEVFDDKDEKNLIRKESHTVYNSQVYGSALFVYFLTDDNLRSGHHAISKLNNASQRSKDKLYEQQLYSIGVSTGQLILTAGLLGYKTGLCSAFKGKLVKDICNTKLIPKLMVGIGFENIGVDRQLATETLNKELPEKYRNGPDNNKWKFPSFDKKIKVKINE